MGRLIRWLAPWRFLHRIGRDRCWADVVSWKLGNRDWENVAPKSRCADPAQRIGGSCYCGQVEAVRFPENAQNVIDQLRAPEDVARLRALAEGAKG